MVREPRTLLIKLLYLISPILGDKAYLKLLFPLKVGYKLSLRAPKTYNEKLQWLKIYYRNPDLPMMVDKFEAKKYVGNLIGEEYIIPTLGVWDCFEDIDLSSLPQQFVLKTTHDQGGVIICKDRDRFDIALAKKKITSHLKRNFGRYSKEWPYKMVRPRVILEEYMVDAKTGELKDYKFFCFNGEPKLFYIASNRQNKDEGLKFDYFDLNFNRLDIKQAYANSDKVLEKPKSFDKMLEFSKMLSRNLPHVRVDFYEINERLFFGELTFFHHSGFVPFYPAEWDYKLGDYIKLPK